jgi:HAMP domain-containing protein
VDAAAEPDAEPVHRADRIGALETEVDRLRGEFDQLKAQFAEFRRQFE